MVAIRKIFRKTITYILIGVLIVTSLTSLFTSDVYADEITTDDNPYKGNPDNVFDLMKNSWIYTVTQLGFFVNDMCTFDLNSIGVGACQNKIDYEEWLSGHNMTTDDVVDSYDASTGTVNLSINYVKNVYNDVLDAVQEDEGWYWSSGKSGLNYFRKFTDINYRELSKLSKDSKYYIIIPLIKKNGENYQLDNSNVYMRFFPFKYNYLYFRDGKTYNEIFNCVTADEKNFINKSFYICDSWLVDTYNGDTLSSWKNFVATLKWQSGSSSYTYRYHNINYSQTQKFELININRYDGVSPIYGKVDSEYLYFGANLDINNFPKFFCENFIYGVRQRIFNNQEAVNRFDNGANILLSSINENIKTISIKLDDLNRDWLKVNNEIKDLIDDYMQDFQDYTDKQDKIDAAISSTLTTMNENLAAGKEDLIGAIKESSAVQQLWLERIYNKEVEIYTKYLEENEQTQAVLVGIANQMKEYFDSSLKNQGNYLTYEQFAAYAQQIIDAINNSGGSSGTGTDGSAVDMSTVDEYIKKIYEKEVNLYDELQAISKKLDNINDNLTKYLWNTDKSIPFLADIANLIKDGFEKCSAPLDILSEKLDELINLAKSILAVLSLNTLIDSFDRTKSDDEEENVSIFTLVKMIMYLVLILGSLVALFLKILQYIILMFQIPAEPALFNENILLGWNYANSICIPGTSFSIIAFLRLLMYITVIFTVVKVLRREINNGSIGVIK